MVASSKTDTIRQLIGLFEKFDVDQALTHFTDDALYQFGNYPPAIGKPAIEATTKASHMDQIKGIAFDIKHIWEAGDSVICEMEINYTRNDDSVLTLPCTDTFLMAGDMVKEMRVYMDATPLFMPPQEGQGSPGPVDYLELAKKMFAAAEANNVDEYITYFTNDAIYKVANLPPVVGPEGIREFAKPVMQMFKTVVHNIKNTWVLGDTVVCELDVVYTRNDDKVFSFPCLDILKMKGDKCCGLQAFIDVTPAFS